MSKSPSSLIKPPSTQQSSRSPMRYKLAGFVTGSDFKRIACTRVKMAVLAPMPSEMVRITVAAKPGDFRNWRSANFRSYIGRVTLSLWTLASSKSEQLAALDSRKISNFGPKNRLALDHANLESKRVLNP